MDQLNHQNSPRSWFLSPSSRSIVLPSTLMLLLTLTVLTGCATADLRSSRLKKQGLQHQQELAGKTLLKKTAEKHGYEAWKKHTTLEMTLRDDWQGFLTWLVGRPWDNELLNFTYELGTFNARVIFLDGDEQGEIYGIHSWQGYEIKPGKELKKVEQSRTDFFIPAILYLSELPFRLIDAPIVGHISDTVFKDTSYDLLFATWDRLEAHKEHDQYILWVNKKTGLVDFAQYTIREQFKFAKGGIKYENYKNIEGVMLPFTMTINSHPDDDGIFHKIVVQNATFDSVPLDSLHYFNEIEQVGDAKKKND